MRAVAALAALAVGAVLVHGPMLRAVGRYLVLTDPAAPGEAIIVLSGSLPDRVLHGVDLFKAGYAPLLVLTRESEYPGLDELRSRGFDIPERHDLNLTIALQLGVPRESIVVLDRRSSSTLGEMGALIPELRRRKARSVLLVTSKTHARRAAAIFRELGGGEFALRISPTPYDPFSPDEWWHHRVMTRRLVTEYGKWAAFQLIDRWRIKRPGAGGAAP